MATLVALSGPAMANDVCCFGFDRFASPVFLDDGFVRDFGDRDVVFLDEDCD